MRFFLCVHRSAISQHRAILRRLFNAEDAEVGAEERRGESLCDLCENLCALCVKSGGVGLVAALRLDGCPLPRLRTSLAGELPDLVGQSLGVSCAPGLRFGPSQARVSSCSTNQSL
jgi:hypothetical protein